VYSNLGPALNEKTASQRKEPHEIGTQKKATTKQFRAQTKKGPSHDAKVTGLLNKKHGTDKTKNLHH